MTKLERFKQRVDLSSFQRKKLDNTVDTIIPDNEFSSFCSGDLCDLDSMHHNVVTNYDEVICVKCGKEWLRRKDESMKSDMCYKCKTTK